jgi:hypothetical protein
MIFRSNLFQLNQPCTDFFLKVGTSESFDTLSRHDFVPTVTTFSLLKGKEYSIGVRIEREVMGFQGKVIEKWQKIR